MRAGNAARRLLRALLAARLAALVVVGPVLGVLVIAATFGLGAPMLRLALAMALFAFALLGLLVRAEYRRLPAPPDGAPERR